MNDIARFDGHNSRTERSSESILQALDRLAEAYRRLENCRAARTGLTGAETRCLLCFNRDKYHTVKGLAGELGLVKSRITRIADGLTGKGLLERFPDPEDRRICLLKLTPEGTKKLAELNRCCCETFEGFLQDISLERRGQILGVIAEIIGGLEQANQRELSR